MLYDCAEIPMLQLKDQNISYEKERDRNTNVLGKEKGVLESENVKYFGTKPECYKKTSTILGRREYSTCLQF